MGPSSDKHNKVNNPLKMLTSLLLKKCVASTDIKYGWNFSIKKIL